MDSKLFILLASLMGFCSVALGAFGAHALKQKLSPEMLNIFEVGARYQMYHALALLFVGLSYSILSSQTLFYSGWFFVFGSLIFSGSLYTLALTGIKTFGAITPIGGILLLLGWGCLIFSAIFSKIQ